MATYPSLKSSVNLQELINPTERQLDFLRAIADFDYVLYGGAAGGGKSYILRWWLVVYLYSLYKFRGMRNVQVGLFCEDYPSLHDRQISKIKFEFPSEIGQLKEGTVKNFQLRPEYGGGMIALRNLDDPSKYQSAEFAAIAVDELTKNSKETFDFLRFRMRWPGLEHPKFAGASNPGGKGHAWVKKLWIEREFPPELSGSTQQFAFVPAKASDNPYLPGNYYDSLKTLPPDMARKFAEGDWDVYTGQYFTSFDPNRHVITASEALKNIKPWHKKWISGDWGEFHPACFHWHAEDEHGRVTTYRELWGTHMGEENMGREIGRLSQGEKLSAFYFSWDAFGKLNKTTKKSFVQMIGEALPKGVPHPTPADSSPGSRISGWRLMDQLLQADMWLIADSCPKLIQCIPTLIRDEDNEEDVLKVDYEENEIGDDAADSARYGLQNMLSPAFKPRNVELAERLTAVAQKAPTPQDAVHNQSIAARWFDATYQSKLRPFRLNRRRPQ